MRRQVDYDDVSGELLLPYVSEDIEDANDFEVELAAAHGLKTIDHRPQTIDHRPQPIDHRPQTIDHRP